MQNPQRQCHFHFCMCSIRVHGHQRFLVYFKKLKNKSLTALKIMLMIAEHNKACKLLDFFFFFFSQGKENKELPLPVRDSK